MRIAAYSTSTTSTSYPNLPHCRESGKLIAFLFILQHWSSNKWFPNCVSNNRRKIRAEIGRKNDMIMLWFHAFREMRANRPNPFIQFVEWMKVNAVLSIVWLQTEYITRQNWKFSVRAHFHLSLFRRCVWNHLSTNQTIDLFPYEKLVCRFWCRCIFNR